MMTKQIDFLDLKKITSLFKHEYTAIFQKVLDDGWYILGKNVREFEAAYAEFSNTKFSVGLANGLDALTLSLKALEIGHGDEIIVPSNTYIASWLAVSQVGATVVPVEPRIDTYNIDTELIEKAITPKTKAVMAVNLYGHAAELIKIKKICDKRGIYLMEDNAQSQGATCSGLPAGSIGLINGTSFYPGKNLGAFGDAGAITTNDEHLADKIKTLRNYGSNVKYYNEVLGYNSRLDELQAALLICKLNHLQEENNFRNDCAAIYNEMLGSIEGLVLPVLAESCTSVYHIFLVRTKRRDELQKYLTSKQIGTMIHYPVPPHLQKAYSGLGYKKGDFPIAEQIAETCLSLPMGPHLSIGDIKVVCENIHFFFKNNN